MAIRHASVKIIGIAPLLQNNPRSVDRFDVYAKGMAAINAKKTRRTDEDFLELRNIEMRSKIYWSETMGGIFIPTTWLLSAIAATSFKVAKVSKADIRGCVFMDMDKVPLQYRGMDKVREPEDIVRNEVFRHTMTLKQCQARVVKAAPIFHEWSFGVDMEFDDKIMDRDSLERVIHHTAKYGGFGDFRPTFGRAKAEVSFA